MSDDTTIILQQWVTELSESLALEDSFDIDAVLALAGVAAHAVVRPAAPLTTFIAGYAAALAAAGGLDAAAAMAQAIAQATQAANRWGAEGSPDA